MAKAADPRVAWSKANTVNELRALTISFLHGEIEATPVHLGPLAAETTPIIGKLAAMNELGILTMDSQPGRESDPSNRQRAYVECLCSEALADRLEERLRDSGLVVMSYSPGASAYASIPVNVEDGRPFTFAGRWSPEDTDAYRNGSAPLDRELDGAWGVFIFDPLWGKNRLWDAVLKALRAAPL